MRSASSRLSTDSHGSDCRRADGLSAGDESKSSARQPPCEGVSRTVDLPDAGAHYLSIASISAQTSGCDPSTSVNPYSRASWPDVTDCWFHRPRSGSAASADDCAADVTGRLGGARSRAARRETSVCSSRVDGVAPVVLGDVEGLEHHLRAQEAWRDRNGSAAKRLQLVSLRERQPIHRDLGEVVEGGDPVVRSVVVGWCRR